MHDLRLRCWVFEFVRKWTWDIGAELVVSHQRRVMTQTLEGVHKMEAGFIKNYRKMEKKREGEVSKTEKTFLCPGFYRAMVDTGQD